MNLKQRLFTCGWTRMSHISCGVQRVFHLYEGTPADSIFSKEKEVHMNIYIMVSDSIWFHIFIYRKQAVPCFYMKKVNAQHRFFLTLGCLQTGRNQLLLIVTIVLISPCFLFTHNRVRTSAYSHWLFYLFRAICYILSFFDFFFLRVRHPIPVSVTVDNRYHNSMYVVFPVNGALDFSFLISLASLEGETGCSWSFSAAVIIVKLHSAIPVEEMIRRCAYPAAAASCNPVTEWLRYCLP
mgnify:CR=1 FL=1